MFLYCAYLHAGTRLLVPTNVPHSTTLPATCAVGDMYQDTDATSGSQWYLCESANLWVLQGGGGGGGNFDVTFNAIQATLSTPDSNVPAAISNSTNSMVSSLLFDASTDENAYWTTVLRPFTSGTLKAQVYYSMLSATSGSVYFDVSLMCVSDGDSADIDTASFAAVGSGNATVPGTAGYMDVISITPTDDSCVAGDLVILKLTRDANNGSDTATGDAEVRKVRLYAE